MVSRIDREEDGFEEQVRSRLATCFPETLPQFHPFSRIVVLVEEMDPQQLDCPMPQWGIKSLPKVLY